MSSTYPTDGRVPPLTWRRPAPLWGLLALAIGLGAPALALGGEGGFAHLVLFTTAVGMLAAFVSLAAASLMGRPPRSRREVLVHALWMMALAALAAPIAFQALLTAMEGIDAPNGPVGLAGMLPFALWPLALSMGLPLGLFAGLVLGYVALTPAKPEGPLTLTQETDPALAPNPDDALF